MPAIASLLSPAAPPPLLRPLHRRPFASLRSSPFLPVRCAAAASTNPAPAPPDLPATDGPGMAVRLLASSGYAYPLLWALDEIAVLRHPLASLVILISAAARYVVKAKLSGFAASHWLAADRIANIICFTFIWRIVTRFVLPPEAAGYAVVMTFSAAGEAAAVYSALAAVYCVTSAMFGAMPDVPLPS